MLIQDSRAVSFMILPVWIPYVYMCLLLFYVREEACCYAVQEKYKTTNWIRANVMGSLRIWESWYVARRSPDILNLFQIQ